MYMKNCEQIEFCDTMKEHRNPSSLPTFRGMSAGSGQQINAGNSGRPLDSADKPRKVGVYAAEVSVDAAGAACMTLWLQRRG